MWDSIKSLLVELITKYAENSLKIHAHWLSKTEGWIRLVVALIILVPLTLSLFESNWKNGISLLFSGSTAIFSGVIYKGRNVMALVVAGVLIGATVLPVFLGAWNSISGGDTVGALITAAVGVFIWIYSATLKSGNIPE